MSAPIDPKKVVELVNAKLRVQFGGARLMDGPVFMAVVESIIEAVNETLEPFLNPVVTIKSSPDVDSKLDKVKSDAWTSMMKGIGGVGALPRPAMILHDEVVYERDKNTNLKFKSIRDVAKTMTPEVRMDAWPTPEAPMTTSVAYRCSNHSCPPRAPMSAPSAPICYTCGKHMEKT